MKKFEGCLILSDIDGTLTNDQGEISAENAEAVRRFQSEGGLLSIASGRYPWYIEKFADRLMPNTYVIGVNGTMLYHPVRREIVCSMTMTGDFSPVVRRVLSARPEIRHLMVSTAEQDYHISKEEFENLDSVLAALPRPWYRTIFIQNADRTAAVKAYLQKEYGALYSIDRSWEEGVEVHAAGSGKGAMLREIRARLAADGTPVHTAVCVGDYENDLTMFQEADIGYAVSNALPEVRAAASRMTVSHNDHALAAVIADLERTL